MIEIEEFRKVYLTLDQSDVIQLKNDEEAAYDLGVATADQVLSVIRKRPEWFLLIERTLPQVAILSDSKIPEVTVLSIMLGFKNQIAKFLLFIGYN